MVPFAGYEMPVQYTGVKDEHTKVRTGVGVFDVSHMGEFFVKGPEAIDLLQKITTNDVSKLFPGKVQYSCFPNGKGGIVDDLLVYCMSDEEYMLVVNASNIDKDWDWVESHNDFDCSLENRSDIISLFAVQGPKATEALQSLTEIDLAGMKYYTFEKGQFAGVENVIVSATGYTGAGGFEIYVDNRDAEKVFDAIMQAGAAVDIQPIGLAARDTLRLEMGFCLYGNDIDDTTSPIEAGLGWITKFTKDFIDKDFLQAQKENGVDEKLVGFEMIDRGIPRKDYSLVDAEGNVIGRVTSGTQSPSLDKAIGLGYVKPDYAAPGSDLFVQVRSKNLAAKVVKLPFYK
jgi:aminomethyltransferase